MSFYQKNISIVFFLLIIFFLFFILTSCVKLSLPPAQVPFPPGAFYVGSEECAVCHEDVFEYYRKSVHFKIRDFEVSGQHRGCESCHGPGSVHVTERGNVDSIISFSKLTPSQSTSICLECHNNNPLMNWSSSLHALSDIGCNDCHKSHKITSKKMVYKGDPDLCYDCHQQMRAKAEFPSHHPIREGKLKCTACHDTHGAEESALKTRMLNDLCFDCHTDKQGPFIYEHPPAEEACSLCHDPHGTIANNLLKQSEPFLCLRCHQGHRSNPGPGSPFSMGCEGISARTMLSLQQGQEHLILTWV